MGDTVSTPQPRKFPCAAEQLTLSRPGAPAAVPRAEFRAEESLCGDGARLSQKPPASGHAAQGCMCEGHLDSTF